MYLGSLVEEAPSDALYAAPKHAYTKALMSAVPLPDPAAEDRRERTLLQGDLPAPANPPSGCTFHTRCPWAQPRCATERPALVDAGDGHKVACHYVAEIESGALQPTRPTDIGAVTQTDEAVTEQPDEVTKAPTALLPADSTTKPDADAVKEEVPAAETAAGGAAEAEAEVQDAEAAGPAASGPSVDKTDCPAAGRAAGERRATSPALPGLRTRHARRGPRPRRARWAGSARMAGCSSNCSARPSCTHSI